MCNICLFVSDEGEGGVLGTMTSQLKDLLSQ